MFPGHQIVDSLCTLVCCSIRFIALELIKLKEKTVGLLNDSLVIKLLSSNLYVYM